LGGVIVCPELHAAQTGQAILARGGNAMDAAIAAAFVQGVEDPLYCGIGGGISIYYWDRASGRDYYIKAESRVGSRPPPTSWSTDYRGATPGHRVYLRSRDNEVGYRAVGVPGFVKGAAVAFERFGSGKISWNEILEPAIRLARVGVELSPIAHRASEFVRGNDEANGNKPKLETTPAAKHLFHRPNGSPLEIGDRLIQTELAATLERLASAGASDFYVGEIAGRIADDFSANSGLITAEDLASYTVEYDPPIRGQYHGIQTVAQGLSNGVYMIEALHILEHFELRSLGHNSSRYVDLLAKVMRACWSDFCRVRGLERDEFAALEREFITPEHAAAWAGRIRGGEPVYLQDGLVTEEPVHGTTALNCVDDEGNFVSHNHSIGIGGSGVVTPGLGFLYNSDNQFFSPFPGEPRSLRTGRMFGGYGSPLALFRDGRPYIVAGAPCGTRIPTAILQSVLNVYEFGMDMLTAVTAPRVHSEAAHTVLLEHTFRESIAEELRSMGNEVIRNRYHSRPQAVLWRDDTNQLEVGSDPRCGGAVATYPPYDWRPDFARKLSG
jgi:gamma-glutamyltranspeptidase / glutathione hydrolase